MQNKTLLIVSASVVLFIGGASFFLKSENPSIPTTAPIASTPSTKQETSQPALPDSPHTTASTSVPVKKIPTETKRAPVASEESIIIKDYAFVPSTLTIKKGTTVTWANQDIAKHTVSGDSGGPSSGFFGKGESYRYTFDTVGTFPYHCEPHPYMTATIIVTE